MAQVKITETVLRDGHQSIAATRMRLRQMLPVLEAMDEIGYNALECWGGATFDTCMRFLDEDPWERLRTIKKYVKKTPLQMLFRGQNILGYRHYADDVVYEFVNRAVDNGIDIIRVFDALNDPRNMEAAIKAAKKIMAQGPVAVQIAKKAINNGINADIITGLAFESNVFGLCFATADQKEGMKAFMEKRKPEFTGK